MKSRYTLLSALLAFGFIISGCNETPEEKVKREVREGCENVRKLAPPTADQAQVQKMIDSCVESETQRKLQQLKNTQGN